MKHLKMMYALAKREVIERRSIFALALVFGLISVFGPYVFGLSSQGNLKSDWRELSAFVALMLGIFSCLGVAFFTGVVLFGRDLSEKRIGFYFSRPIPALSLWTGKILAGWALILGSFLATLVPSFLVGANPLKGFLELTQNNGWILLLLLPFLLLGVGLIASIAFRSRSRWLIFDLVAIPIILLLVGAGLFPLYRMYAEYLMFQALIGFGIIAGIGMLLASAISTTQGRTNLIQTHRVISLVLCTVLLIGAGSVQVYARWALSVTAADLVSVDYGATIHPNWVVVSGKVAHRERFHPIFLYNIVTGHTVSLDPLQSDFGRIACSKDGRRCAWIGSQRRIPVVSGSNPETGTVSMLDTTAGTEHQAIHSDLVFPIESNLIFSPDGNSLVVTSRERVEFIDFQSRRITSQLTFPLELQKEGYITVNKATFVSSDILRLYRAHPKKRGYQIVEFNRATREFKETGFLLKDLPQEISLPNSSIHNGYAQLPRFCDSIDRVFISLPIPPKPENSTNETSRPQGDESGEIYATQVFDSQTGKHLFSLPPVDTNLYFGSAIALSDKRLVQLIWKKGTITVNPDIPPAFLQVFSAEGVLERTIPLEKSDEFQGSTNFTLNGEVSDGQVLLISGTETTRRSPVTRLSVVNCNTGEIKEKSRSNSLLYGTVSWFEKGTAKGAETQLFTELIRGKPRTLIYFNPETGEKRTLLGAKN